jgi:methionyl-tRNA formyltransferase
MGIRIALFGQAAFGKDVFDRLRAAGHEIAGVFAPPEGRRPDPLAAAAEEAGVPLLRPRFFRRKTGEAIPARVLEHAKLRADLNALAYVTAFVPIEILEAPRHGSLCFHPSLLPEYRGGSAIPWQIILGASESGVTVFRPDSGVDTGPIVVQKGGVAIGPEDTAGSLYFEKLYALGVEAMVEAVERVARGGAEPVPQDESRASFQGLVDDAVARIDWSKSAAELARLIRGCDPQPGAYAEREGDGARVRLFDARLETGEDPGAAPPGSLLAAFDGRFRVAASGGVISFARARVGDGSKVAAAESGLREGERLA